MKNQNRKPNVAKIYNLIDYKIKGGEREPAKLTDKEMRESMDFRKRNRDKTNEINK